MSFVGQSVLATCPKEFASIFAASATGNALNEFEAVYVGLINSLGGDLKPRDLQFMAEHDSFSLPKEVTLSSSSLTDSFSQLKDLIAQLGLSEVEVKGRLSATLTRLAEQGNSVVQREDKVQRDETIHPVVEIFNKRSSIRKSRDGRILYHSLQSPTEFPTDYEFIDSTNRKMRYHFDIPYLQDLIVDEEGMAYILTQEKLFKAPLMNEGGRLREKIKLQELVDFGHRYQGVAKTNTLLFVNGENFLLRAGEKPLLIDRNTNGFRKLAWPTLSPDLIYEMAGGEMMGVKHLAKHLGRGEKFTFGIYELGNARPKLTNSEVLNLRVNSRRVPVRFLQPENHTEIFALAVEDDTMEKLKQPVSLQRFDLVSGTSAIVPFKGVLADFSKLGETHYFDGLYPLSIPTQVLLRARSSSFQFFLLDTKTFETKRLDLMAYLKNNEFANEILSKEEWTEIGIEMVSNTNLLVLSNGAATRFFRIDMTDLLKANE